MAQVKASTFAREALALSLVSDVATRYFEVLSLRERLALAHDDVTTARAVETTVKRRVERGDLSLFELEQQGITVADAAAREYELAQNLASAEGELAFLIGRPRGMLELAGQTLSDVAVPQIAPGVPGAVICRRPDVRQAEAELAAARANLGVARKSLLPTFSLTAEGGLGSANLASALAPQSIFTDVLGQLVQSIFDGGRRRGEIAQSKAVETELLQRYQTRILGSLRDVEEALAGVRFTGERLAVLANSAARASRMLTLSTRVFDRGAIDYATLLDSQRFQYRIRAQAVEARYDRLRAAVDLYKALGGGMAFRNDPCVKALVSEAGAAPADSAGASSAAASAPGELPAVAAPVAAPASPPTATGTKPAKRKSSRW
jgi:outer membrane protein TolC